MGQIRFSLDGVDMTPPTLSAPTAVAQGTSSASWAVTSDEAGGTIFAAARLSSAGVLSRAQIEAGSGAAVATSTDASPTANGSNSGTLNGLNPSTTYRVDMFHRDANGNQSAVISAPGFTTNSAGSATVTIDLMESSGVAAPQGAFFEAHVAGFDVSETLDLAQYDDSFARLRYRWTITRQGQSYVPQTSDKVVNLPVPHNDTNTAYGKRIGHVFTEPGTYTITCEVQDNSGTTGQGSTSYVVVNPDTLFTGNRTILVGAADAAYPGAQVVSTTAQAKSALDGLGTTGRILLRRGSTHANASFSFSSNTPNVYIGAYGTGARPILGVAGAHSVRLNGSYSGDCQVIGIEMAGGWDSTTESGNRLGSGIVTFDTTSEQYLIVVDCDIHSWGTGINSPRSDNYNVHHATYVHQCNITGGQSYSGQIVSIAPGSYYCATGNYCGSRIEDFHGGPKDGTFNNHGPWRFAAMGVCYVACNDMFQRAGWTPGTGPHPSIQPCLRWNTSNYQGMSGVFERNAIEGEFSYTAGGNNSYGSNLMIEKNLFVGHSGKRDLINLQSPGATIRSNIFVHPNAPVTTNNGKAAVAGSPQNGTTQFDPTWPVEIYSNTIVNQMNDANRNGFTFDPLTIFGFNLLEANNVYDTPNATGQSGEAGLNLTQARMPVVGGLHNPRWQGRKGRTSSSATQPSQLTMDTTFQTPDDSVREFGPGAGSAALSGTSGRCAIDDFYSTLRPVTVGSRARGAVEP